MPKPKSFNPELLLDYFTTLPDVKRILVAFSGGMDSSVLLHALSVIKDRLPEISFLAVHINHGLQKNADLWSGQCEKICQGYGITYKGLVVDAIAGKGESPEAVARDARYRALAGITQQGDCVVTAHHQDDQAETLLLQLARGSGLPGLASMAAVSQFHAGLLVRPLLGFSRSQLNEYAQATGLEWIDDPSNFNRDFDRNFLRHNVMPVLEQRWPNFSATVSRSAQHIAQADELLEQLSLADMNEITGSRENSLSISGLLLLGEARANNVIRAWIKKLGLPTPQSVHIQHIHDDVLVSRQDAQPSVCWHGCEIRRYQDDLVALQPPADHDSGQVLEWQMDKPITIPGVGTLSALSATGRGLRRAVLDTPAGSAGADVSIRFRQGGERCQPAGRAHTHDLKKLFQEFRVPAWERDRIPLIYINDTLACITGYCYCQGFAAVDNEPGLEIELKSIPDQRTNKQT